MTGPTQPPRLFLDLGSPYSWLAFERIGKVLGVAPKLEPILLGGIFVERGYGSWSQTKTRQAHIAEIERRASEYGIGPVAWPQGWPNNTLKAMRCAIWAEGQGHLFDFTRLGFRKAFRQGEDLSDPLVLTAVASASGLEPEHMLAAIETDRVKTELRSRTKAAWELGVTGAPTLLHRGQVFYGDDQLEAAAAAIAT